MSERHYSDDEVAATFEQASKTEHPALPAPAEGRGMTVVAFAALRRLAGTR